MKEKEPQHEGKLSSKQVDFAIQRTREQIEKLIELGVDVKPLLELAGVTSTQPQAELVEVERITIGERFRKDLGDLDSLVESIKAVGLLHPVVVSSDLELIAGFRRLEACKKLGWVEVPCRKVPLKELKRGEFDENMVRKDFLPSEQVAIKRAVWPEVSVEAKERQEATHLVGRGIQKQEQYGGADSAPPIGKTREVVGRYVGVSHDTLTKAERIVEAAESNPDKYAGLLKRVDAGSTSINHAYQLIIRNERNRETPPLPDGEFNVILADPPWDYRVTLEGSPEEHYPTMSSEEITSLKIPAAEDAILFLWSPNPKLDEALPVLEAWGFTYKTNMAWVKNRVGLGFYVRSKHELLLIGTRGKIGAPDESNRPNSVIEANSGAHSVKPQIVYELIEQMYPQGKYLELFARQKREGWIAWGNEIAP